MPIDKYWGGPKNTALLNSYLSDVSTKFDWG